MSHTALLKAILTVTRDVKPMEKDALNQHGNYKYVNIDHFYAAVKGTATKAGLHWQIKEGSVEFTSAPGRNGPVVYGKWVFGVDLMHLDEVSVPSDVVHWPDYDKVTIYLPHTGAQATGIARSYAEKVFMRTTFKLVTGEPDADFMTQQPIGVEADAKEEIDLASKADELKAGITKAKNNEEIDKLLTAASWLSQLKSSDPEVWNSVRSDVTNQRKKISSETEAG